MTITVLGDDLQRSKLILTPDIEQIWHSGSMYTQISYFYYLTPNR